MPGVRALLLAAESEDCGGGALNITKVRIRHGQSSFGQGGIWASHKAQKGGQTGDAGRWLKTTGWVEVSGGIKE